MKVDGKKPNRYRLEFWVGKRGDRRYGIAWVKAMTLLDAIEHVLDSEPDADFERAAVDADGPDDKVGPSKIR